MIQVYILSHIALAESSLDVSYGQGSIPDLKNLTYKAVRELLAFKKTSSLILGFNKHNSHCLVWENKALAKQFKSKQFGMEHFLRNELFLFCNWVHLMGEKKGSIKWSLPKCSLSWIMSLK